MVQSVHRWNSVSKTDLIWFAANTTPVPSVMEHVQREKSHFKLFVFHGNISRVTWGIAYQTPIVKAHCFDAQDYVLRYLVFSYVIIFHYFFCITKLRTASPFCKPSFHAAVNRICTWEEMMVNYFLDLWSGEEFEINYNNVLCKLAFFPWWKGSFLFSADWTIFQNYQGQKSCLCSVSAQPNAEKNTVCSVCLLQLRQIL